MVVDRLFAVDRHKISVGGMTVNRLLSNMPAGLVGTFIIIYPKVSLFYLLLR